jgi:hypothetical protein
MRVIQENAARMELPGMYDYGKVEKLFATAFAGL